MSLSSTIVRLSSGTYDVTRASPGTYVDGRWTAGATTTLQVLASIQPTRGQDLLRLPEGQRTREVITIYSTDELLTANAPGGTAADLVSYRGASYEVQTVEAWDALGGYFKSLALKVGQ